MTHYWPAPIVTYVQYVPRADTCNILLINCYLIDSFSAYKFYN